MAPDNVLGGASGTPVGHMSDVDMRYLFEPFHREMMRPADPRRSVIQLALVHSCIANEFIYIVRGH